MIRTFLLMMPHLRPHSRPLDNLHKPPTPFNRDRTVLITVIDKHPLRQRQPSPSGALTLQPLQNIELLLLTEEIEIPSSYRNDDYRHRAVGFDTFEMQIEEINGRMLTKDFVSAG